MAHLGRNINGWLVFLIVAITIAMLSATVYFQKGLNERTDDLTEVEDNFLTCVEELEGVRVDLQECEDSELSAKQDINKYDEIYVEKVNELENTESELIASQRRATNLELQKASLTVENNQLKNSLSESNEKNILLQKDLDTEKRKSRSLQEQLRLCEVNG